MDNALAINLRRLRKVRKLTQAELAKMAGISRNAFRNIETGISKPRTSTFYSIARALGVSVFDLVRKIPTVENMRFRTGRKMTVWEKAEREQIALDVALWLLDFNDIEKITVELIPNAFEEISFEKQDPEGAAGRARDILAPENDIYIEDLPKLLQNAGIKLLLLSSRLKDFNGLSVGSQNGGPAIVINAGEWIPVESQIYSAARELGHILLHPGSYCSDIVEEDDDEIREADEFAGYFLMPRSHFEEKWNSCRGTHWVDRVLHTKRLFKVSYKTILDRLVDNGAADSDIYYSFVRSYNNRYDRNLVFREKPEAYTTRSEEPSSLDRAYFFEDRLARMVMDSLDRHEITMSRAAEILKITVSEVRRRVWDRYSFDGDG